MEFVNIVSKDVKIVLEKKLHNVQTLVLLMSINLLVTTFLVLKLAHGVTLLSMRVELMYVKK